MKRLVLLAVFVVTYQTWEASRGPSYFAVSGVTQDNLTVNQTTKREFFDENVVWHVEGREVKAEPRQQADLRVRELKGDPHRNWDVKMYELKEVDPR